MIRKVVLLVGLAMLALPRTLPAQDADVDEAQGRDAGAEQAGPATDGQSGAESDADSDEEELDAEAAWSQPADDAAFQPSESLTADSEISFPADI